MGRSPCCDGANGLKKGPWTPEEDQKLIDYVDKHGTGNWKALPKQAGLNRCGKSCRLRWANYLRPDIKRGKFSEEEDRIIINLHADHGNKWSKIASHLPGRTDNEIKNYWNTHIRKKLIKMGIDPVTHKPRTDINHLVNLSQLLGAAQLGNMRNPYESMLKLQADAAQAAQVQLIQNLLQIINTTTLPTTTIQGSQFQLMQKILQDINTAKIPSTSLQNTETNRQLQSRNDYTFDELPGSMNISHHKDMNTPTQQILSSGLLEQGDNDSQSNTNSGPCFEIGVGKEVYNPDETSCSQMAKSLVYPSCSAEPPMSPSFDTWDTFLDDNSSDSYWKDILDFTSLLSPVSGSNTILQNINL